VKGLNQVNLIGNLGTDPEMRFTATGKPVTSFSMATSRKYKNDEGALVEDTTWHKIITWDRLAEICNKSLNKGEPVYVQGRIQNRSWEDDTGKKHYSFEIVARDVIFLGKPKQDKGPDAEDMGHLVEAAIEAGAEVIPEEIPF